MDKILKHYIKAGSLPHPDDIVAVGEVCVLAAVLVLRRGEVVGRRGRHVSHLWEEEGWIC